ATSDKKNLDVGASLFIGNLDLDVDEKCYMTLLIARDPDGGNSKWYGFISYDNFDSSDAAIDAMNGQYLMNKPITVSYVSKKDERLLAAQAKIKVYQICLFADIHPATQILQLSLNNIDIY
ncbi:11005_t:CDS:2, partial [Entrophospora sp. SA101]